MAQYDDDEPDTGRAACRRFDEDLAAYLEGEDRPAVAAHARECPFCGVILADLEQIRFAGGHIPLEEPPPGAWANIRARLASEGMLAEQVAGWQRWLPRFVPLPASAPLGALACLIILGLTLLAPSSDSERKGASARLPFGGKATLSAVLIPGLDMNLVQTVREMETSYRARETFFEPSLKATYRKSLESLDASIRESLSRCQHDPSNSLAREYLINAYQSKAEVLASALEFYGR